jgi:hypothetical protein
MAMTEKEFYRDYEVKGVAFNRTNFGQCGVCGKQVKTAPCECGGYHWIKMTAKDWILSNLPKLYNILWKREILADAECVRKRARYNFTKGVLTNISDGQPHS